MGLTEYRQSIHLAADGSFYGLLMAAMRNADTDNLATLKAAFPQVWQELHDRYNAPGGCLTQAETDRVLAVYNAQRQEAAQND